MKYMNTLYTNDNLLILHGMNTNSVDLIYLDPPFNSKRIYSAPIASKSAGITFKDMWTWEDVNESYLDKLVEQYASLVQYIESIQIIHSKAMMAYITYMTQRIIELYRILKDTGSIYLHVDPTASHYLKIVLDQIFGKHNFRNEIVWCYRGASYPKKDFGKRHDIIYRYSKSNTYIFNLDSVREPYAETTKQRFQHYIGNKRKTGNFGIQTLNPLGKQPDDWWPIQPLAPSSKERTGYPTQKPLALLHKIIKASSNEDDIVLDPFCGCATTCVAAEQLHRKWIGIDIEEKATDILIDRLSDQSGLFKNFIHRVDIPKRTDLQQQAITITIKEQLYKQQQSKCKACNTEFEIRNLEVDHIIPRAKGGGNYYENYQLLCSSCNGIKGNRPMEYLRMKLKAKEEILRKTIRFGD